MQLDRELLYTAGAAVCSVIASVYDVKSRRVPNLLTGPSVLVAIGLHAALQGTRGVVDSLEAGLICGLLFLIFYAAGGMGAGDVKLMAAAGCFAGTAHVVYLLVFTVLAGGVMALVLAVMRGRLRETVFNVGTIVSHHLHSGLQPHPEINVRNRSTLRLPYGVAIAVGSLVTLWIGHAQQGGAL